MSLYDGLDIGEKHEGKKDAKPDVSGWGSSMKLLETQKQIQAKKASLLYLRKRQGLTPVFDLKKRNEESQLHFNMKTGKLEKRDAPPPAAAPAIVAAVTPPPSAPVPFIATEAPVASSFLLVKDEYDPARPNDYEEFVKRRREQRQREREDDRKKLLEERERRRRERHAKGNMSDDDSDEEDRKRKKRDDEDEEEDEEEEERDRPRMGGAAIAPPPSLIEEVKPMDEDQGPRESGPQKHGPQKIAAGMGLAGSVVSKMMARMGYREGQGLGKSEQGMSTALQVEKTSKRGGKIIHEKDIAKTSEPEVPGRPESSNANILRNPSKVILLRNMVGPGEVDEELEPETAEECLKYGKVIKCVIFEIHEEVPEEAIRIFVEFERQEAAIKAIVDLNGRYFGGRIVKAGFYNQDKFRRLELNELMD